MKIGTHQLRSDNFSEWPSVFHWGLLLISGLLVFIVLQWFIINPQHTKNQRFAKTTATQQKQLEQQTLLVKQLPVMKKAYQKRVASLNTLVRQLPNEQQLPQVIDTITHIASLNHLTLELLQPQNTQSFQYYIKQPIQIIVVGNFQALAGFINDLSNAERIITISHFSIAPGKLNNPTAEQQLRLKLTAATYLYDPAAKPSKVKGR